MHTLVELKNINLSHDGVRALRDVSLTLNKAEVHAIVGEHSSGKSSLAFTLNGLLRPASGKIIWENKSYSFLSVNLAKKLGIRVVTQQSSLFPLMTVADNFFIKQKKSFGHPIFNEKKTNSIVKQYLKQYSIPIDETLLIKNISLTDRYLLDILINIFQPPKLLILDEALASLTTASLNQIIPILEKLKQDGMAILFITHRIDNVYEIANRVTILKNGEVLLTELVDSIDKTNLIRLAYTQISKETHIDDAYREFNQLLKYNEAILENLPVNMIVVDRHNKVKLINNYAKKYLNVEDIYNFNMPIEKLFLPDNKKFGDLICESLEKNTKENYYNVPVNINEAIQKNDIIIYPILDGKIRIGSVVITNDITEQDKFREQIILSEKLASVGLLAAGVAHEINNPLEIIYSCLDYIKQNLVNKKLDSTIDDLTEEIAYIAQIVSNLVTFSDKHPDEDQYFDVNELISSMINLIKFSAKKNYIEIHFMDTQQCLNIKANKIEIKQVFLNIIKNSFEAMPAGGKLQITTKQTNKAGADFLEVTFHDTGKGIQDDEIKNIFLPFYSTKAGKKDNLGLGLSVSYGIIKKYKGEISVQKIKHSGTEFLVRLPLA
jgi:signal transduction histidine kinase/ABC-type branched-subunit amino acid transport system ATPase component